MPLLLDISAGPRGEDLLWDRLKYRSWRGVILVAHRNLLTIIRLKPQLELTSE